MAGAAGAGLASVSCCVVRFVPHCSCVHGVVVCLALLEREDSHVCPDLLTKVMFLNSLSCRAMQYGPSSGAVGLSCFTWEVRSSFQRTVGVRAHRVEYVVGSERSKFVPSQSRLKSLILKVNARSPLQFNAITLLLSFS